MYANAKFRGANASMALGIIEDYPFAYLISGSGASLICSHLPIIVDPTVDRDAVEYGDWDKLHLLGHMARSNPQHGHLDGADVLIVFSAANAYVSPTWYGVTPSAPTWNYIDVQVRGRVRVHRELDEALAVIERTVSVLESRQEEPWSIEPSMEYVQRILPGVVSFDVLVDEVDFQFKLSQDKPATFVEGVIGGLGQTGRGADKDVAELMRRYLPQLQNDDVTIEQGL